MGGFSVAILFGILTSVYLFFAALFAAVVLYAVISYIFEGFSSAALRKKAGYTRTGTAWIPFYNKYLLGKAAGCKGLGAASGVLTLLTFCLCAWLYVYREPETTVFALLGVSVFADFIVDTIIAHGIFKSRMRKYGDVLTVANVLTLGLLRPILIFAVRNRPIENVKTP